MIDFLVGRELQTLHSLRRMFVKDLRERVRKAQVLIIPFDNTIQFQISGRKYRLRFGRRVDRAKAPNRLLRNEFKSTYHCAQAISAWQRRPQMWITETWKATASNSGSCPKPWMWVFRPRFQIFYRWFYFSCSARSERGRAEGQEKVPGRSRENQGLSFLRYSAV